MIYSVNNVCQLDENRFISAGWDKTIKLWRVPNLTLKDYCIQLFSIFMKATSSIHKVTAVKFNFFLLQLLPSHSFGLPVPVLLNPNLLT